MCKKQGITSIICLLCLSFSSPAYAQDSISKNDLLLLVKAQRESINDIKIEYEMHSMDLKNNKSSYKNFIFAKKGRLVYLLGFFPDEENDWLSNGFCINDLGYYRFSQDKKQHYRGSIYSSPKNKAAVFGGLNSPYGYYMLLDTEEVYPQKIFFRDLVATLEHPKGVNIKTIKNKTIVYFGASFNITLLPEKNYAVGKIDTFDFEFSHETGQLLHQELKTSTEYANFLQTKNGLWFAQNIEKKKFNLVNDDKDKKKQVVYIEKIRIKNLKVNEGVDDREFNEFMPEGTEVYDDGLGVTYIEGENKAIESVLTTAIEDYKSQPEEVNSSDTKDEMVVLPAVVVDNDHVNSLPMSVSTSENDNLYYYIAGIIFLFSAAVFLIKKFTKANR